MDNNVDGTVANTGNGTASNSNRTEMSNSTVERIGDQLQSNSVASTSTGGNGQATALGSALLESSSALMASSTLSSSSKQNALLVSSTTNAPICTGEEQQIEQLNDR